MKLRTIVKYSISLTSEEMVTLHKQVRTGIKDPLEEHHLFCVNLCMLIEKTGAKVSPIGKEYTDINR